MITLSDDVLGLCKDQSFALVEDFKQITLDLQRFYIATFHIT
jgi:hypothetical protein